MEEAEGETATGNRKYKTSMSEDEKIFFFSLTASPGCFICLLQKSLSETAEARQTRPDPGLKSVSSQTSKYNQGRNVGNRDVVSGGPSWKSI